VASTIPSHFFIVPFIHLQQVVGIVALFFLCSNGIRKYYKPCWMIKALGFSLSNNISNLDLDNHFPRRKVFSIVTVTPK